MRTRLFLLAVFACSIPVLAADSGASAKACGSLKQLTIPDGVITFAETVAAGAFTPPNLKPDEKTPHQFKDAPAFCRVKATLKPTVDSDIKVEVWMPLQGWNGGFRGTGKWRLCRIHCLSGLCRSGHSRLCRREHVVVPLTILISAIS